MPDGLRRRTVFRQRLPLVALALLVLATGCTGLPEGVEPVQGFELDQNRLLEEVKESASRLLRRDMTFSIGNGTLRSMEPAALMAPAFASSRSASVVLPVPESPKNSATSLPSRPSMSSEPPRCSMTSSSVLPTRLSSP